MMKEDVVVVVVCGARGVGGTLVAGGWEMAGVEAVEE